MEQVEILIRRMRDADEDERDAIKEDLVRLGQGPDSVAVRTFLEQAVRGEVLEIRWELEEVLDTLAPPKPKAKAPPPPKEEPPPPPEDPKEVKAGDLVLVYEDRRGIAVHRTRKGDRWFLTQPDPYTGQFQTFEVPPHQVDALKAELSRTSAWRSGDTP